MDTHITQTHIDMDTHVTQTHTGMDTHVTQTHTDMDTHVTQTHIDMDTHRHANTQTCLFRRSRHDSGTILTDINAIN